MFSIDNQNVTSFIRNLIKIDPHTLVHGDKVFIINENCTEIFQACMDYGNYGHRLHVNSDWEPTWWYMHDTDIQVYNNDKIGYVYIMSCNDPIYDTQLEIYINTNVSCNLDIVPDKKLYVAKIHAKDITAGDIFTTSWDYPIYVKSIRNAIDSNTLYINTGNIEIDYELLDTITIIRLENLGG